ncbi:tetraspanin-8-like [Wolffia australiana]
MVRLSNSVIGILNVVALLVSIPVLGGGIWLAARGGGECERLLERPAMAVGIFLILLSLAGLVGSCCRVAWLLWVYLLVMFLLIVLVFCFTVFAFVVTNKGAGEVVSGHGYREYRLGDYSHWLQKRVNNAENWVKIRSCLHASNVCHAIHGGNQTIDQFIRRNLSPIQSGCCKPPTECGFVYESPTRWRRSENTTAAAASNADCATWSNDERELCFGCGSCKAGVLANLRSDWKKLAVVNIFFLVVLLLVYSIGCCAFRNARRAKF